MFLVSIFSLQFLFIGYLFHQTLTDTLEHQVGTRALVQALAIASDPQLIAEVEIENTAGVQQQITRLQAISDADFIVVGNENEIRLAHPDANKIGKKMQGGDSHQALTKGEHYYTIREGSLGLSIRGKAPVFSPDNEIIGIVSVGYLLNNVSNWLNLSLQPVIFALLLILFVSSLGAWLFARHIKRKMYDMEPEEIALSLKLQQSVLQAVYEGVIAVDHKGSIIAVNKKAVEILGIAHHPHNLVGRMVNEFITPASFFFHESSTQDISDEVITLNGETLIASRVIIREDEQHSGWVISFRRRNDINMLTTQLSQVKQFTENLRVISHEHANRLSTISGLIQIGAYDKALETIRSQTQNQQQLIDYISCTFHSRTVAGLLLGKYSRAQELGLELEFDPSSQLRSEPINISSDELAAVIGNLLDNAFEATVKNPNSNKKITLLLTDAGDELVVEVADNGPGIAPEVVDSLFVKGATSKEEPGHGIGLYLVHRFVTNAGGVVLVDDAEPIGTIFSLFIPNKSQ